MRRRDAASCQIERKCSRSSVQTGIGEMATFQCRVQYLDDTDPFASSTNFPEPSRPPTYTFLTNVPLINQIGGVKKLLKAPHKVSEI